MCTALCLKTKDHYFGRTLDLDRSYGEEICVLPRNRQIVFKMLGDLSVHYAMIGMATVVNDVPLFYDGTNEYGLSMAGLNFPGNAYYGKLALGKENIAPFEFIPRILCVCKTVEEAKDVLARTNIADISFSEQLPSSPLHWIIADKESCIVVECMKDGMHIHDNPVGVMTNNPPFPYQMENLEKYSYLKNNNENVVRNDNLPYVDYCQGLGAVGLPGDVSSMSRFVRIAFNKVNSVCANDEKSSVGQFFHLLSSVEMVKGACKTDEGDWDITGYTSCVNADKGLYYYTTYNNRRINCVNMYKTDLDSDKISRFPLVQEESISYQN